MFFRILSFERFIQLFLNLNLILYRRNTSKERDVSSLDSGCIPSIKLVSTSTVDVNKSNEIAKNKILELLLPMLTNDK